MTDFYVGQRVFCIRQDEWSTQRHENPVYGEVLTVSNVYPMLGPWGRMGTAVDFKSCPGVWFNAEWFRPVPSRKTDISTFTAMLKTHEVEA